MTWKIEQVDVNVWEPRTRTPIVATFLVYNDETNELVEYEVTLIEYSYYSDSYPHKHLDYEWEEPPYEEMQEVTGLTPQQIMDRILEELE